MTFWLWQCFGVKIQNYRKTYYCRLRDKHKDIIHIDFEIKTYYTYRLQNINIEIHRVQNININILYIIIDDKYIHTYI